MCIDPISGAAMAFQVVGSISDGVSSARSMRQQAQIVEQQRVDQNIKTAYEVSQERRKYASHAGAVQAQAGASGLSSASFRDILADDAAESAVKVLAIQYSGARADQNLSFQAQQLRAGAKSAMTGAVLGAAVGAVGTLAKSRSASARLSAKSDVEDWSGTNTTTLYAPFG